MTLKLEYAAYEYLKLHLPAQEHAEWFVPRTQLRLLTPPEAMRGYTFNKHAIQHQFCPTGGMHPFGEGTDRWLR